MKKSFLLLLLALLPVLASGYDAEIDGIYYDLSQGTKEAEVTSKGSNSYSGNVVIPSSVTYKGNEYSVTSIDGAFYECTGLTSVTIPNSIINIGRFAFSGCPSLKSITIPSSVSNIGEGAFYGCTGLTEVNFNATNCTTMGDNTFPVFYGCTSLTTLTIGNNVQNIPDCAFYGCSGLKSVTIPNSVTSIGKSAFQACI